MHSFRTLYPFSQEAKTWCSNEGMSVDSRLGPFGERLRVGIRDKVSNLVLLGAQPRSIYSVPDKFMESSPRSSSIRRLFPQHRTPLSSKAGNSISPRFDAPHPEKLDVSESNEDMSDGSSSSSSGTVKISALSDLELSSPDTTMSARIPSSDEKPPTPFQMSNMENKAETPARRILAAQPHTPQIRPLSTFNASPLTLPSPPTSLGRASQRKVRWSSRAEMYGPGDHLGVKTTKSLPNLRYTSLNSDPDRSYCGSVPIVERDDVRRDDSIYHIPKWEMSVELYTDVVQLQAGNIEIHHHALLSITAPKQEIHAQRVSLVIVMVNGPLYNQQHILERDQRSLFLDEDLISFSPRLVEIAILQDVCDMEKPLDVYFKTSHPMSAGEVLIAIPEIRPRDGKVFPESVLIAEPSPPLKMTTLARREHSTWKTTHGCHDCMQQARQFERIELPRLYPDGQKDDICIKITEPHPVTFQSLGTLAATEVAWDLKIKVHRPLGTDIGCHMNLCIHVGDVNKLLTFNAHDWKPKISLIGGRLATEAVGEWRKIGHDMVLFKQPWMHAGPLQVEIFWNEPQAVVGSGHDLPLPTITDRDILSASLVCKGFGSAFLTNTGRKNHSYYFDASTDTTLPLLRKGYKLYLNRVATNMELACAPTVGPLCSPLVMESFSAEKSPNAVEMQQPPPSEPEQSPSDEWDYATSSEPRSFCVFLLQIVVTALVVFITVLGSESVTSRIASRHHIAVRNPTESSIRVTHPPGAGSPESRIGNLNELPNVDAGRHEYEREEEDVGEWRDWVDRALGWQGHAP